MWNLAFSFTIAHRAAAFKAYYAIRSFITFHGIFMASGYDLGKYKNIWHEDEEIAREFKLRVSWMSPEEIMARIKEFFRLGEKKVPSFFKKKK